MTDIMAKEAFRTALAETIRAVGYDAYGTGADADPDRVAGGVVDQFREVEWEFHTNEHGVPVKRLAIRGEWVVDLMPAVEQASAGVVRRSASDEAIMHSMCTVDSNDGCLPAESARP